MQVGEYTIQPGPPIAVLASEPVLGEFLQVATLGNPPPCSCIASVCGIVEAFPSRFIDPVACVFNEVEVAGNDIVYHWVHDIREILHLLVSVTWIVRAQVNGVYMQASFDAAEF
jgi:hypothetical protein